MQHLVLYTVVHIAIFMSLHGPAGACIPVASASPIHVPPIQRVLKHCGAYIHIYIYIYIYTHVTQNNLRTPQLAGFARQLGCKKSDFLNLNLRFKSGFLTSYIIQPYMYQLMIAISN